jgi:hypothetical protein
LKDFSPLWWMFNALAQQFKAEHPAQDAQQRKADITL